MIDYKSNMGTFDICERVRWLLGVNEVFLPNEEILSPLFSNETKRYINKYLSLIEVEEVTEKDLINLIDNSYVYHLAYQLCLGMPSRLPIKMENISTKTTLTQIDWEKKGEELLAKCNSVLDDILEEFEIEIDFSTTIIDMSDESQYPSEYI